MKAVFITGTDTSVGKTVVTGLLARYFSDAGYNTITQKWVQTGCSGYPQDIATHLRLMNKRKSSIEQDLPYMAPYTFSLAASPHLAAMAEKKVISTPKIKRCFEKLASKFDYVIAEGAGGALVPVNRKKLLIDIVKELAIPVIIVAENKLGAINQTLMTVEVLKKRKVRITGIVFNNHRSTPDVILQDNPKIIRAFSKKRVLGTLPRIKDLTILYKRFIPIAENIAKQLRTDRP